MISLLSARYASFERTSLDFLDFEGIFLHYLILPYQIANEVLDPDENILRR